MANKSLGLGIASWMLIYPAWAGETIQKTCRVSLLNLLHQYESKSDELLKMYEFRHGVDTKKIFDTEGLKISPVPLLREIFGIYRRPVVARKARSLFSEVESLGDLEGTELVKMLKPNTYYTYVIDEEKISFAQTRPGKMRDYGSKHAILRDQTKTVHLAGEFYVDDSGKFHFDGASGTFQPPNATTLKGVVFFKDQMGISNSEVHLFQSQPAAIIREGVLPTTGPNIPSYLAIMSLRAKLTLENEDKIVIPDADGSENIFKFKLERSSETNTFIYDTDDFALKKKNSELRHSSLLLNENSDAVKRARQIHAGNAVFYAQAREKVKTKIFKGTWEGKEFLLQIDEKFITGLDKGNLKGKSSKIYDYIIIGEKNVIQEVRKTIDINGLKPLSELALAQLL